MQIGEKTIQRLLGRYPVLEPCCGDIAALIGQTVATFENDGTFFCCGNGGSAADCDHICGEFLKGFLSLRPLADSEQRVFEEKFGEEGKLLAGKLQKGLRAISLLSHPAYCSAFANDVDPDLMFGQQLYALSRPGDILLGISTGGGAKNVKAALMAAKACGVKTALLTGNKHGVCESFADIVIAVPEKETYKIQELHLPVYHALCEAVEAYFFGEKEDE